MSEVTLVVSVPLAKREKDRFRPAEMPRAEAEELAAEINRKGTINGWPAHAFILDGPMPTQTAVPTVRPRNRRSEARVQHHAERHPSCNFPPQKVRASSSRWRGERDGSRDDRITAGMRAWDK